MTGKDSAQYIQWPGGATFPGLHTFPFYDDRADGNTQVYSPRGWEWVETTNQYQEAAARLAQGAIQGAVTRMSTAFGKVWYVKGNATDPPSVNGEAAGETCRVQDAQTLDIVAEWRWTGTAWERMQVSGSQVSNLDVGRLTAGSASISELAARRIAGDVGQFLQLTTSQLTVTDGATFNDVIAKTIWTKVVNAEEGQFEKITAGMLAANSVTASNIRSGAIDGQVITGATIRTNAGNPRIELNSKTLTTYDRSGNATLRIDGTTGSVKINGDLGIEDSWSRTSFIDIEHTNPNFNSGTGLYFEDKTREFPWGGALSLVKSDGTCYIELQAPGKSDTRAKLSVWEDSLRWWSADRNSTFQLTPNNIVARTPDSLLNVSSFGVILGKSSKPYQFFHNEYRIIPSGWDRGGLWANANTVCMEYDAHNQVWISSDGVHITGNKQFTMLVPTLSKRKGGKMLGHAATESPFNGIEYWENVTLDSSGEGFWDLPEYVPFIVSPKAPVIVLTSADRGLSNATVDKERWRVHVSGEPGATVAVNVKAARLVPSGTGEDGEPIMRDDTDREEFLWMTPPELPSTEGGE